MKRSAGDGILYLAVMKAARPPPAHGPPISNRACYMRVGDQPSRPSAVWHARYVRMPVGQRRCALCVPEGHRRSLARMA
jgi:hypothetical protein